MLVSKTPLRVSFLGGGSDYESYFKDYRGAVFGMTINSFVYTSLLELNDISKENYRFTYRKTESVLSPSEFEHPVVREVLASMLISEKLNIATMSNVPGGTGLGSSSAFTVGLINLINGFQKQQLDPGELAELAITIERKVLKEPGGLQDQIFAAYGGVNVIEFSADKYSVRKLTIQEDVISEVSEHFALIPVAEVRSSSEFAAKTEQNLKSNLKFRKKMSDDIDFLLEETSGERIFDTCSELFAFISKCLNRSWETKKMIYSPSELRLFEDIEYQVIGLGASAFKICGAGASGFLFATFPHKIQSDVNFRSEHPEWIFPKIEVKGSTLSEI